jgi:lipopolysaccharide transport system permease protein
MVPVVLLTLGVSLILATLNVRYRDVKYAVPFLLQMWMFLTPIIYPTSIVPERFRHLLFLNPMVGYIDTLRAAALPGRDMEWGPFGVAVAISLLLLAVGLINFRRAERNFADVI